MINDVTDCYRSFFSSAKFILVVSVIRSFAHRSWISSLVLLCFSELPERAAQQLSDLCLLLEEDRNVTFKYQTSVSVYLLTCLFLDLMDSCCPLTGKFSDCSDVSCWGNMPSVSYWMRGMFDTPSSGDKKLKMLLFPPQMNI